MHRELCINLQFSTQPFHHVPIDYKGALNAFQDQHLNKLHAGPNGLML